MPPKTRQTNLPSTQDELDSLIADRVAAAIAQHEANRTKASSDASGGRRTGGCTLNFYI